MLSKTSKILWYVMYGNRVWKDRSLLCSLGPDHVELTILKIKGKISPVI